MSRINQLAWLASQFAIVGLSQTADEIRKFTSSVTTLDSLQTAHEEFEKVVQRFRDEWVSGSQHRKDIDLHALSVLGPAIRDPNTVGIINSLVPLFENRRRAEDTIRQMGALSRAATSPEQGFLITMFSYIIEVEGVFDETVRFILILADAANGRTTRYSDIAELTSGKLRERLETIGTDFARTIFDGHVDGHLRNSIAHARFVFDPTKATMTFDDFDAWNQIVSWPPHEMTFADLFNDYYQTLEDTSTFVTMLIGLLQVRGLADGEVAARTHQ